MRKQIRLALSLQEEPFFEGMSKTVVARVETYIYHRQFDTRQIIYFPDDSCDYVYWVREGRVKVTRMSGDGRELTFRHLIAGDMLGEECLGKRGKRGDYAEAMTPTILCLIRTEDFCRLVREEAELTSRVAQVLCQRVVETEQVLADTVFCSVRSRVASGLLRLYRRQQEQDAGALRVTHQELANLIGSTRETTTAVLHGLREEGVVSIANRRLTVLDPIALENLAHTS